MGFERGALDPFEVGLDSTEGVRGSGDRLAEVPGDASPNRTERHEGLALRRNGRWARR